MHVRLAFFLLTRRRSVTYIIICRRLHKALQLGGMLSYQLFAFRPGLYGTEFTHPMR